MISNAIYNCYAQVRAVETAESCHSGAEQQKRKELQKDINGTPQFKSALGALSGESPIEFLDGRKKKDLNQSSDLYQSTIKPGR